MKIPKQLINLSFCRIKHKSKAPFEKDWNNKPYYHFQMERFLGENYGVLCGYRDLAVIDCASVIFFRHLLNNSFKSFFVFDLNNRKNLYIEKVY